MKTVIVDYGAGNIQSVRNAVYRCGWNSETATTPEEVAAADRIILPGVGAAGKAMTQLRASGLDQALDEAVRGKGRPMLGICLGMQLMARELNEFGRHEGLGWIDGRVAPIRSVVDDDIRVPRMGWCKVDVREQGKALFTAAERRNVFYFAHSFALMTDDATLVAATVEYGGMDFVAAVRWNSVFATQFHPEKSQIAGERLLMAFFDWTP